MNLRRYTFSTCQFCKAEPRHMLVWENVNGRWDLASPLSERHIAAHADEVLVEAFGRAA